MPDRPAFPEKRDDKEDEDEAIMTAPSEETRIPNRRRVRTVSGNRRGLVRQTAAAIAD